MPVPMPFEENGVRVHFPDDNTFRLSDCDAYIAIKSKRVKEMDICWFDLDNHTLWLVELKAFFNPANPQYKNKDMAESGIIESVMAELLDKSIHTICQVNSDRAGTKSCIGHPVGVHTSIKLVHLVKTMPGQDTYLNQVQDQLRKEIRPYSAIFNIESVVVLSYEWARNNQILSWIV